jgi:hypothetical protein
MTVLEPKLDRLLLADSARTLVTGERRPTFQDPRRCRSGASSLLITFQGGGVCDVSR